MNEPKTLDEYIQDAKEYIISKGGDSLIPDIEELARKAKEYPNPGDQRLCFLTGVLGYFKELNKQP